MKLKLFSAALAAFPLLASAQGSTSVKLYGVIDTAIQYANNIADGEGGSNSSTHFPDLTGSWPSHWGLAGSEDLGGGLSAVFNLEAGFTTATGKHAGDGRLFGRQSWVGLKSDWGQISFGRQYSMLLGSLIRADFIGAASHGLASLDNYIPNARLDNTIMYRGNVDGFRFGATYSRGRDTSTTGGPAARGCGVDFQNVTACSAWSALLAYDSTNWGVASAYDVLRGGDTTWPGGGLTNSNARDTRWTITAYARFDALKVGLIYLNRKNQGGILSNPINRVGGGAPTIRPLGQRSDLWALNASYQFTPALALDGAVYYINYKDAPVDSKAWDYIMRIRYSLSKRTTVYVSASHLKNKGNSNSSAAGGVIGATPNFGSSQTAVMAGIRHNF